MTFEEAVDEIQDMVSEAWIVNDNIFYEGVGKDRPANDSPFARVFIRHVTGGQRTMGEKSARSFERAGFITVQVFTPTGNGLRESYKLARMIADAFEGQSSPCGVWFREVKVNEVGKDGMFQLMNVVINFEYSEIK